MNIYKPTYTDNGKLCNAAKWYADFRLQGKRTRFPLFSDKRASQQLADKVEKLLMVKHNGDLLDGNMLEAVERMPDAVRAKLVRLGILSGRNARAGLLLSEVFKQYETVMGSRDLDGGHIQATKTMLSRIAEGCSFMAWSDIEVSKVENFLKDLRERQGRSYRTSNAYLKAFKAFCNWMVDNDYAPQLPAGLRKVGCLNTKKDQRRQRRAFTIDEIARLIEAARRRPLLDAETVNRGPQKGAAGAELSDATRQKLVATGEERALTYKVLFSTGLRENELRTLTVSQLRLRDNPPRLMLDASDEKNAQGSTIALRADIAAELAGWVGRKLKVLQDECRASGKPLPMQLPGYMRVLDVPAGLLRIFERDRELAGIPKRDDRGRTVDIHALRTSFGTHLSKAGVNPRTVQAAMRHSDIRLTMGVYTDPQLLDIGAACEKLPALPVHTAEGRRVG